MTEKKNVLVTGATGFIGSHLVRRNLAEGHRVRALVRPGNSLGIDLQDRGVEVAWGDLTDAQSIREAVAGSDVVFHAAATVTDWAPRKQFEAVNVQGTENVCRESLQAGVQRLVFVSTCDVFGLREGIVIGEDSGYHPWGEPYPDTKIRSSQLAMDYNEKGLPVSMVYPCWVYGPGDKTFMPLLADAVATRQMLYFRRGAILWMSYIDNVIDLLMLLAEHPKAPGHGFLVHDGTCLTLEDMCDRLAAVLQVKRITRRIPYWLAYSIGWVVQNIARLLRKKLRPLVTTYSVKIMGSKLQFTIEKAQKMLGWTPPVSCEQGLETSFRWLKGLDTGTLKKK